AEFTLSGFPSSIIEARLLPAEWRREHFIPIGPDRPLGDEAPIKTAQPEAIAGLATVSAFAERTTGTRVAADTSGPIDSPQAASAAEAAVATLPADSSVASPPAITRCAASAAGFELASP